MTEVSSPPADEVIAVARRGRSSVVPITAVAVAVVLGLFVWLLATSRSDDKVSSPLLGLLAPAVTGEGFRGERFDLDAERGNWVLVNFFSTTCIPCQIEHPELVELERRYATSGALKIVSVTFEDKASAVQAFFEQKGGTWPVLLTDTGRIAISYGVTAVPESYLVAPDGTVVRKIIGGITADDIATIIDRAEAR